MNTTTDVRVVAGGWHRPLYAVLAGGFLAGTLDILDAFVVWGLRDVSPLRVLQGIASGVLGRAALEGGVSAGALGAALHFFISCCAAAAYFAASRIEHRLVRHAVPLGIAYGAAFYLFMTFVVVPLSAFPGTTPFRLTVNGWFAHTILFGLPIALTVRFFGGNRTSERAAHAV